jgi:DNA-binding NtrC family response regulator
MSDLLGSAVGRPLVVVIDRDARVRLSLTTLCRDEGYEALALDALEDPTAVLAAHRVHLLVLDPAAARTRLDVLLHRLAGARVSPPVLLLSSSGDDAALAASFGVARVRKPFRPDDVLDAIGDAIVWDRRPRHCA